VLLIAEIETDGDGWYFRFHGSEDCITALTRRQSLPSHLILFASGFIDPPVITRIWCIQKSKTKNVAAATTMV
jgi:hypothetical protein